MACTLNLFGTKPLPEPMLTFVNWTQRDKLQLDLKQNTMIVIKEINL